MPIKKEDVKHIARLARLKLTDKEIDYFAGQLANIIDYIDQLKEVDTSNVGPTSHAIPIKNVFRKDNAKPSLEGGEVLKNAPSSEKGFFKVPRIIEEV
jgi:aspartyl-tRNA(Asn)/glutamyl-tRNA(Gln) amidotransferase subunit C